MRLYRFVPSSGRRVDYCIQVDKLKIVIGRSSGVVSKVLDVCFVMVEREAHC